MAQGRQRGRGRGRRATLFFVAFALLAAGGVPPPGEPLPQPPAPPRTDDACFPVLDIRGNETLVLGVGSEARHVRLAGVYAPRAGGADGEAVRYLTRLLTGESVWLEFEDESEAYAYRVPDGLLVNLELVRQGYARVVSAGELKHRPLLTAYERLARQQHKGIWAPPDGGKSATASQPAATNDPQANGPEQAAAGEESDAASQPAAEPASGEPRAADGVLVYVTPHGKKYHRQDCQHVRKGATALTLREARARGYTPCSRCKPPE